VSAEASVVLLPIFLLYCSDSFKIHNNKKEKQNLNPGRALLHEFDVRGGGSMACSLVQNVMGEEGRDKGETVSEVEG